MDKTMGDFKTSLRNKYGTLQYRVSELAKARHIVKKMAEAIVSLEGDMDTEVKIRDGVSDLVAMTATLRSAAMSMEREREAIMEMALTEQVGGEEG